MHIRFIDLFAGIGGLRLGLEQALEDAGHTSECVLTSEIKSLACKVLQSRFDGYHNVGDVTRIDSDSLPDFDFLLAGFPCQAFSTAGKKLGFEDIRGTLFFDVARILKAKRPRWFVLENVKGLVTHQREHISDVIGRTLQVILGVLDELGYNVSWKVLDASLYGSAQRRERIFICGSLGQAPDLDALPQMSTTLGDFLDEGVPPDDRPVLDKLLAKYEPYSLQGCYISDYVGSGKCIPGWWFGARGDVSELESSILDYIKGCRKLKGLYPRGCWIFPATFEMISQVFPVPNLEEILDRLLRMGYLRYCHPKGVHGVYTNYPEGWAIQFGKATYGIQCIMDLSGTIKTLTAFDADMFYLPTTGSDGRTGLRRLTKGELCRLSGFPADWCDVLTYNQTVDAVGNSVVVPLVRLVAGRTLLT